MKRPKNNIYIGKAVSFPEPWVAIPHRGSRLALGDIVGLCDLYAVPVFTFESDPITNYIRPYEAYHHIIELRDGRHLSCSYLSLPRLVLAARNSELFATLLLETPLSISEG